MASFYSIPYFDIISFLNEKEQLVSDNKETNYLTVWTLISSNPGIEIKQASIVDFVIAYNLSLKGIQSLPYKASIILTSPDKNLRALTEMLNLDSVDKERIIRILSYLNFLDNDI